MGLSNRNKDYRNGYVYPKDRKQWTYRDKKGNRFEDIIFAMLILAGFKVKNRSKLGLTGCDFKIRKIEIECKFTHAIVFPCWIKRDWIPRFSNRAKHKIVVINRGMKLSEKSLKLLRDDNIKVIFYDELITYLSSLKLRDVSNHLLNVYVKENITGGILVNARTISKFIINKIKIINEVKNRLIELISKFIILKQGQKASGS